MMFVKLSLLVFYYRTFAQAENFRLYWTILCVLVVGYSTAGIFCGIFACIPVQASWELALQGGSARCINRFAFYSFHSSLNMVTDIAVLLLPMPHLWKLKLSKQQKLVLCFIFSLGSLSVTKPHSTFSMILSRRMELKENKSLILSRWGNRACSISLYRIILLVGGQRQNSDFTYGGGKAVIWS